MSDRNFKIKHGLNVADGKFVVDEGSGLITYDGVKVATSDDVTSVIGSVDDKIGTLASLTTTDKTDTVSAINEVDANTDTNATNIGTLASLTTTNKTDIVSAINEVDGNVDALYTLGLDSLTIAEVTQLQNIDTTTISTTQWGYVGALDQGLTTSNTPSFSGLGALSKSAGSTSSIMILGGNATMTADNNICLGSLTGTNLTTGDYNVYIGNTTGYQNQIGVNNFMVGYQAGQGQAGLSHSNNTFIGRETGKTVTTGGNNNLIGFQAGMSLTSGEGNVCLGLYSGRGLASASENVILGTRAGYTTNQGGWNTIIGEDAGRLGVDMVDNIIIGDDAGYYRQGNSNILLGYQAGRGVNGQSNTGEYNIYMGEDSGLSITTGANNIGIGPYTSSNMRTGSYNVCVGYLAGYGGALGSYVNSICIGYSSGQGLVSGSYNTLIGDHAGDNMTTGSNNICIGKNAKTSAIDATYQCIIGGTGVDVVKVGIGGQNNPQESLDVIGNGLFSGTLTGGENWTVVTGDGIGTPVVAEINHKYMVDTSAPATAEAFTFTGTPANIGDTLTFSDMKGSFATNNCQVTLNTVPFEGSAAPNTVVLNVDNTTTQFVYTGPTYGWKRLTY